jgi:hypothetical protein
MIEYGWGNLEQDYLVIVIKENWHMSDFMEMTKHLVQMAASVNEAKLIFDLRASSNPPAHFMMTLAWFFENLPANTSTVITISNSPLWNSLFHLTHKIHAKHKSHCFAVSHVDTAYQLLLSEVVA